MATPERVHSLEGAIDLPPARRMNPEMTDAELEEALKTAAKKVRQLGAMNAQLPAES